MIHVQTHNTRYPIHFADDVHAVARAIETAAPGGRLLIITDDNVGPHYLKPLQDTLTGAGRVVRHMIVPAGESSKSIAQAAALWDEIFSGDVDRQDTVIALGGGVVGDLAGFVAASTMRGIQFVQVPTTMLAMSDAAIGGKTGVNVQAGKNLVGAFHQPLAVIPWIGALRTLPHRQLVSGLAEVIKSALLDGQEAVTTFQNMANDVISGDLDAARRCATIGASLKARIVSDDEREHGVRSFLNLGHTFAHAIEHAAGYGEWTHGEAVAVGMVIGAQYARDQGVATDEVVATVRGLVTSVGLPDTPPKMPLRAWVDPIFRDKKRHGDAIKIIMLRAPGDVFGQEVPLDSLSKWIEDHLAK